MHGMWKRFDSQWMKPIFGGRVHDPLSYIIDGAEEEEEVLGLISSSQKEGSPAKDPSSHRGPRGSGAFMGPGGQANGGGSSRDRVPSLGGSGTRLGSSRYHPPDGDEGL